MDPNKNIEMMRDIATRLLNEGTAGVNESDLIEFAELFEAMDEWLCGGGFLPDDWAKNVSRY